jgi:cytidylate kinase
MIITISGLHGTGKSTIGKIISKELDLEYYSTGQAFRELAQEFNMDLKEFTQYAEEHPEIDINLDNKIIEIAKKGDIVIDSQLSGHILKDLADFKIHLTCPIEIRVKRMAERDNANFEAKYTETILREESELQRFKRLYNIDLKDFKTLESIYDLIIDTENLSIDDVVKLILSNIKLQKS